MILFLGAIVFGVAHLAAIHKSKRTAEIRYREAIVFRLRSIGLS